MTLDSRDPNHFSHPHHAHHELHRKLDHLSLKADEITRLLHLVLKKETLIMADLTSLTAQVKTNTDVEQSAIVLIQGIAAQLAAAKTDPAAIQALSDSLNASAASLADAVTANTPAA